MDYKPVNDWDEAYLEEILDGVQRTERNHIEFKSSFLLQLKDADSEKSDEEQKKAALKKEKKFREALAQALSAFGNRMEGGYFVVGVDNSGKIDGGLALSYKNGPKEWFDRIIPRSTDKESLNCDVKAIGPRTNGESRIKEHHAVVVIWIPPHPEMPIRSNEGKHDYYYRTNAQSVPLDTQQVVDIIHRRTTPRFEMLPPFTRVGNLSSDDESKEPFELQFEVKNSSNKMALHVGTELVLPVWLTTDSPSPRPPCWLGIVRHYESHCVYSARVPDVVFPHQSVRLPWGAAFEMDLRLMLPKALGGLVNKQAFAACPEMAVILYADDAPPSWWCLNFEQQPLLGEVTEKILNEHGCSICGIRDYREITLKNYKVEIASVVQEHLGMPIQPHKLPEPEQTT